MRTRRDIRVRLALLLSCALSLGGLPVSAVDPAAPATYSEVGSKALDRLSVQRPEKHEGKLRDGLAQLSVHAPVALNKVLMSRSRQGELEMAVTVEFDPLGTEAIRSALADLGAVVLNSKPGAIEAYIPRAAMSGLAEFTEVRSISPILRRTPSYVTSSIDAYGVPAWHAGGLTGTSVKVGIIDGGFQGIGALLGSELPASVHGQCYTDIGQFTDSLRACDSF